jgi:hypothetical protein
MSLVLISIISYLLGSIPFSYLVAKAYGKNLYQVGSGNIGTANVWRATGKIEATFIALVGDLGKGILSVFLAQKFFPGQILPQALAAFFAVLGSQLANLFEIQRRKRIGYLCRNFNLFELESFIFNSFGNWLLHFLDRDFNEKKIEIRRKFATKNQRTFYHFHFTSFGKSYWNRSRCYSIIFSLSNNFQDNFSRFDFSRN